MRPLYEVADVLQRNHHQLEQLTANSWQSRTLYALAACRTYRMGGHIDKCTNSACNYIHISYNSCRNRHCPKCQGHKQEEWIQKREEELLKVPYYHVVFTLPDELNRFVLFEPKMVYNLLFKVAWSVITDFAKNPKFIGAKTGMIAILHTWGQALSLHPHLHCIVPGGGIAGTKWKYAKGKNKYLFPVKAMSKVFRARFVEALRKKINLDNTTAKNLFTKNWVIYCKQPFFGPLQVIEYLGRYTHKIAISNHRIQSIDNGFVTFIAKNYRHGGEKRNISLPDAEFIRRFSIHILPKGFTRIRHYGILSSSLKKVILPIIEKDIGKVVLRQKEPIKHGKCPVCRTGDLITILRFDIRGPPKMIHSLGYTIINKSIS